MSSEESEEHPLLRLLLNERLPTLGLDIETYGPYIVALFPLSGTFGDDLVDELEGWDEILELLQASSELQDLDENVWEQLKVDLLSSWQSYQKQQAEQQKEKLLEKEVHLQKMLELERDVAKMNAEGKGADSTGTTNGSNNSSSIDDAAKRALLNRFGYEEDENDDTGASNKGKADTAENTNATSSTMKHQHPPVTTKREEQQKTKAAQQQKVDAKEERRKRATKGERRR